MELINLQYRDLYSKSDIIMIRKYELDDQVTQFVCCAFILNLPDTQFILDRLVYHTRVAFYYCYDNGLFYDCKANKDKQQLSIRSSYMYKFCRKMYECVIPKPIIDKIILINQISRSRQQLGILINERMKSITYPIYGALIYKFYPGQLSTQTRQNKIQEEQNIIRQLQSGQYQMNKQYTQLLKLLTHKIKVLLVQCANTGKFGFPKGKIDQGEQPHQCAIRQVFQQTQYIIETDIDNCIEVQSLRNSKQIYSFFFVVEGSYLDEQAIKKLDFSNFDKDSQEMSQYFKYKNKYEIQSAGWDDISEDIENDSNRINYYSKCAYNKFLQSLQIKKKQLINLFKESYHKNKLNAQKQQQFIKTEQHKDRIRQSAVHIKINKKDCRNQSKKERKKYRPKYPQKQKKQDRKLSKIKRSSAYKKRVQIRIKDLKIQQKTSDNSNKAPKKKYVEKSKYMNQN